jgi:hypothetical protein
LLFYGRLEHEVSLIEGECCTDHPPLPPRRRRLALHVLDHDERRVAGLRWSFDPVRVVNINMVIGSSIHAGLMGWSKLFGDPNAASHIVQEVVAFPPAAAKGATQ